MKRDKSERTRLEQEAGARRQVYYQMVEGVEAAEKMLRQAFPSLEINCEIPAPYDIIDVVAWRSKDKTAKFYERVPISCFPSDELVAKLALFT